MKHLIKITFLLLLPLFISYTLPASAQGTIQRPGAKKEQSPTPPTPKTKNPKTPKKHTPNPEPPQYQPPKVEQRESQPQLPIGEDGSATSYFITMV